MSWLTDVAAAWSNVPARTLWPLVLWYLTLWVWLSDALHSGLNLGLSWRETEWKGRRHDARATRAR